MKVLIYYLKGKFNMNQSRENTLGQYNSVNLRDEFAQFQWCFHNNLCLFPINLWTWPALYIWNNFYLRNGVLLYAEIKLECPLVCMPKFETKISWDLLVLRVWVVDDSQLLPRQISAPHLYHWLSCSPFWVSKGWLSVILG